MPSAPCVHEFQYLESLIFFVVFVVGLTSNALFILLSCKKVVNLKGCPVLIYNGHLVHCSIANIILLISMPLDVISFSSGGFWFFGEHFCRLHFFVERALYMTIANHILNLVSDAFAPYGYPKNPFHWRMTWFVSLLFVSPLMFTTLEQTPEGCTRCVLMEPSLGKMWMFQWSEQVYVAVLPLLSIWFCHSKYVEHPDYEALHKAGPDDFGGQVKLNLRSICCALALTICLCTSPARLTEISGSDFRLWPGRQIIFFFVPRLLIYGQTILFIGVYAYHYPCYYQGAKIAAARLWSRCKLITGQDDDNKELLSER